MLLFSNSFIVIDILCSKLPCTVEGCEYRTLQKKNLETHILRQCVLFLFSPTESLMHSIVVSYSEKKYKCKDDLLNCTFKSCDPAALLRHRKTFHGYIPRRRRKPVPAPGPQPPAVPSRHRKTRRRVPVVVPAPTDRVSSSTILSPNSDSFPFGEMTSESSLGLQVPPMSSESSPHFPLPPGSLPPCQWDGGFWVQRNAPVSYDCQWHGFGPANPTTSHGSGHQFEHNTAEFHWQLPTYSHLPLDTWSPSPFFDYSAEWHQTPSQSQSQLQHGW